MTIRLRWLGYVCFEIVLPSGKVLVVDPFIDYSSTAPIRCDDVTGADYIAITHGHFDHVTDVGPLVRKFGSRVICSHDLAGPLARLFGLAGECFTAVTAGDVLELDGLRVEVRQGKHVDLAPLLAGNYQRLTGKKPDPNATPAQLMEALGPLLSRSNSPELNAMMDRIRHAGLEAGEQLTFVFQAAGNLRLCFYSSDAYEFLRQEVVDARANVFLAQLGGVGPRNAAEVAALSGAAIVIPTHHDGTGEEAMRRSSEAMARLLAARSPARFLDIVPGQWYEIAVGLTPVMGA